MSDSKNGLKSGHILEIMNYIEDEYIESALKRLDYMGDKYTEKKFVQKSPKKPLYTFAKRVAIFIGIVVLATTTTVATAMAVNEDFRETVKEIIFEFLHIEEEEVVPQLTGTEEVTIDTMYVEPDRSILGGVIEGRYVHAPVSCNAREGVYVICTDEIELNQGSHYDAYYEENGDFIKLEEHTFRGDYTVLGQDFHLEFDWAVHNGQVAITYIGVEEDYRIPANPGNADAMLVEMLCSVQTKTGEMAATAYPVLINLETGELNDILARTGAEKLGGICNQAVSEDGSKMLLAQENGALYCVDLETKTLYSVEKLSGEKVDACSLIGDTLSCWVLENGVYRAWSIDLNSLERKDLFSGIPNAMGEENNAGNIYLSGFDTNVHWGTMFTGSHFSLETDELGKVTVIDMATGEKVSVEGLIWPADRYEDVLWEASPDGKRLLISGGEIGSKYEYIGVLDFEKMRYLEFVRVNPNEVYEWKPYWFDKDTVIIQATSKDSYYVQDFYVYDLLDKTAVIVEGTVEKVPTVEYAGKDYCISIPEEGWQMNSEECWTAKVNPAVQLWITDYSGEDIHTVLEQLYDMGYAVSEVDSNLLSYQDENDVVRNVRIFAMDEKVAGVFYNFPVEATEGFGTRLAKIVSTFHWIENIEMESAVREPADEDFVRILDYIPDAVIELRYASGKNFTGQRIYDFTDAWLRYGTVKKLMEVQEKLKIEGLYLKIWDAFRPPAAQFTLWEAYPDAAYVSDPNKGFSSHSKGNTVDINLVDADGVEVIMPSDFDDFSALADRDYSDCSKEAAENAMLLETLMEENGFKLYQGEWWHYSDTESYDVEQSFTPVD